MVTRDGISRRRARKLGITDIEAAVLGITVQLELNAIELWVTDPGGKGFRTWIGAYRAMEVALTFAAAALRLHRPPDSAGPSARPFS
jgi:hypothetical protein